MADGEWTECPDSSGGLRGRAVQGLTRLEEFQTELDAEPERFSMQAEQTHTTGDSRMGKEIRKSPY